MKLLPIYLMLEEVSLGDIKTSILRHNIVEIVYDDGEPGTRTVEPYAFGEMKSGNPVIRAFQTDGPTKTVNNQWKIFRTDKIRSYKVTDRTFDKPRPNFNSSGDKTFAKVTVIADFNKSFLKKAGDFLKKGVDKVKSIFKSHHERELSPEQSVLVEGFLKQHGATYDVVDGEVRFLF